MPNISEKAHDEPLAHVMPRRIADEGCSLELGCIGHAVGVLTSGVVRVGSTS